MDRIIRRFDCQRDSDLRLCLHRGVGYQKDMSQKIEYGDGYHDHYQALEGTSVAVALNAARA